MAKVQDQTPDRTHAEDVWLQENLAEYRYDIEKIPLVIQYNKRDLGDVVPLEQMRKDLNTVGAKDFEAVATDGTGVVPSMKYVVDQILEGIKKNL